VKAGRDELDRFSALVNSIYEGSLDPTVWPEVIGRVSDWLGVKSSLLYTPLHTVESGGQAISHGFSWETMQTYQCHYHQHDVWTQTGVRRKLIRQGNCLLGTDLVPIPELKETQMFREFLQPNDIPHLATAVIFDGQTADTLPTVFSNFRGERDKPFDEADRRRLSLILPHLSRAMGIMFHLREVERGIAATLSALDNLRIAILLVADDGRIAFANRAALQLIEQQDGLRLRQKPGTKGLRLVADDPSVQARIDQAIRQNLSLNVLDANHFGQDLSVTRPSGRSAYALRFSALPEQNEFAQGIPTPRAVIFLSDDGESLALPADVLGHLLGLTPAEARLAAALVHGESLAFVAARLDIKLNTAKTQLQAIYAKLGVDSRAKLVKRILSLAGTSP
jgi:DNA-binding CsgD family transcriptional regulator